MMQFMYRSLTTTRFSSASPTTSSISPQRLLFMRPTDALLTRRVACALLASSLATTPRAMLAVADDAAPPIVTSKARITIAIGTAEPQTMTVGLYGQAAPQSVQLFLDLCRGSIMGSGDVGLSYRGSSCTRVERDRTIVLGHLAAGNAQTIERSIDSTGYVRSTLVNLADSYTNEDANGLSHDRAGLLSMRKGGGEFEWVLTPAANPALDSSRIVVGEVLENAALVAALNDVPARRPSSDSEVGGVVYALGAYDESKYAAVAKAGNDPRARIEQAYRPLQKIRIVGAEVVAL